MRLAWIAGLALLLALPAAVGPAAAHGSHTVVHEASIDGPGWTSVDVEDPNGHLLVEVEALAPELPVHLGVDVTDDGGQGLFLTHVTFRTTDDGVRVEVGGNADLLSYHQEGEDPLAVQATFTVDLQLFGSLDPTALAWSAGEVSKTTWTVEAGDGATSASSLQGSDTFLATDDDLQAPLAVEKPTTPAVRAQVLGERTVTVDRDLVGVFVNGTDTVDVMRAEGPDTSRTCPCVFADLGPSGTPAGDYRFQATGAGTGEERWLLLAGADASLPPTAG